MTNLLTRIATGIRNDWRDLTRDAQSFETRGLGSAIPGFQAGKPQWPAANVTSYVDDGYQKNVILFACVNYRAGAVASAPLRVYRARGGGQRKEIEGHPLTDLMLRPNPEMSGTEFLAFTQLLMDTTGFAVVEKVRSAAGRPVQLWHLRSDWIKPIPRDQQEPDWEYRVPGNPPFRLDAEDVMVITAGDSPKRGYTGLPAVAVALREIGIENAATDFLKLFFDRGAMPQVAITLDPSIREKQFGPAQALALKEAFRQSYGGWQRWVDPAILGGGVAKIERLGFNMDEMAYPELRNLTAAQICSAYQVTPILIGAKVGLEHMTYSNYAEARRHFYEDIVSRLWARMDGAITRSLLPEFEADPAVSVEFDTTDIPALQDDVTPTWQRAQAALGGGGITVDEYRAELNLTPLPKGAGKVLYLPFSVTVTKPDELIAPPPDPKPVPAALVPTVVPVADGTPPPDGTDPKALPSGDTTGDGQQKSAGIVSRWILTGGPSHVISHRDDERGRHLVGLDTRAFAYPLDVRSAAAFAATNRKAMAKLAKKGAPKLQAFWRAQGERIIGAATRSAAKGQDGHLLGLFVDGQTRDVADIDWQDEERQLAEVLGQYHGLIGETAFGVTSQQIGVDLSWDLANPNVRRVLKDLAGRITGINETTREDVRRVVNETLDAGGAMDDLARNLRGLFEETYKGRAMTVARTESMNAYNRAAVLGYQESNQVAFAECADNPDHDTDPGDDGLTCAERNGLVVPLEETDVHIEAEHPNGTLACLPVLIRPLGEEE